MKSTNEGRSSETRINHEKLRKKIVGIVNHSIGLVILRPNFIGKEIWNSQGSRAEKIARTADLVAKRIGSIEANDEYSKVKSFLNIYEKRRIFGKMYSISSEQKFKDWVLDFLCPGFKVPTYTGEIIIRPGTYSIEDYKKIIKRIMADQNIYNPDNWVEEFVGSKLDSFVKEEYLDGGAKVSTPLGSLYIRDVATLRAEVAEFVRGKREQIDRD